MASRGNVYLTHTQRRSTAFFYLGAATYAGQLLANPLAYLGMQKDVWIPVYVGICSLALATGLSFMLPATRAVKTVSQGNVCNAEPVDSDTRQSRHIGNIRQKAGRMIRWLAYENGTVGILLGTVLFTMLGRCVSALELQYMTQRYGWSWSEVSEPQSPSGSERIVRSSTVSNKSL